MIIKKIFGLLIVSIAIISFSCSDNDVLPPDNDPEELQTKILEDFAKVVAIPNYQDIQSKASELYQAVQIFNQSSTDANLSKAQSAWLNVRQSWERCESFLFGPVEDFNYDPTMDDWPVNKVDLDSLLASTNPLELSDIEALPTTLKGFHPIEYLIFGVNKSRTASELDTREKKYLASLTQSLYNTTTSLINSWDLSNSDNFANEIINAGNGSQRFSTRQDAFLTIVSAMIGICEEVAEGKMEEPLMAQDSTLVESQFAHNSTTDFKNNITGVLNVYLGKYSNDGAGLNELVSANNISLDNNIQNQINAAISSFDNITDHYGLAIYNQQMQIKNTQAAISTLKNTLENDLIPFIQTYVKD